MKSFNFKRLVIIGLTLLAAETALAKEPKAKTRPTPPPETVTETRASSHSPRMGLGLASISGDVALSAFFKLDPVNAVQTYLSISDTSPFTFMIGGSYKHTVAESQNAGLHIGGALSLGTTSGGLSSTSLTDLISGSSTGGTAFMLQLTGLGGLHWTFTDIPHVMFSLDGGPTFSLVDGHANFTIGGLSSLLGLSVIYML